MTITALTSNSTPPSISTFYSSFLLPSYFLYLTSTPPLWFKPHRCSSSSPHAHTTHILKQKQCPGLILTILNLYQPLDCFCFSQAKRDNSPRALLPSQDSGGYETRTRRGPGSTNRLEVTKENGFY